MKEEAGELRVLMVNKYYHPRIGGVETLVRTLSERYVALGHEVTVLALDDERTADEVINGVRVVRFKRGVWGESGFHPEVWSFLMSADVAENFDIVHVHGYHTLIAFEAALFCRMHHIPFVFTTHYHGKGHTPGRDVLFKAYRVAGKRIYDWSGKVVCVSDYERSLVGRDFTVAEEKYAIIPNGGKGYQALDVQRRKDVILYVGRLVDYKGLDHVLAAMAKLKQMGRRTEFRIVGDGPDRQRLEGIASSLGLEKDVVWVGRISEDQLNAEYRTATVLVLLSSAEAYGLVVAEALTCGTPCIVTKAAALTEFTVEPGCFGIEYPIDDDELAGRLAYVFDNAGSIKIGPFSNKMITWDQVAEEYLKCYDQVRRQ
ncbi:MAG: UDP-D-galactose:(glucosyl)lipopolysaccharide-1,6-D-galactosyltransferase [Methanomassiliicoccales archaeon PtaU1.Bin124]|nr:MAG: UDP-D-galactose:(glucosyl)lipopolysaccharide-1,6-D-galactosyltransferase [Methanomassiliicoccales archaeon PtaU1.Bin124]